MNLTAELNAHSIEYLREQMKKKVSNTPYFASNTSALHSITDMDHHPYTRWFRGVYYYPEPIVMEREAGWRPRSDYCYQVNIPAEPEPQPDVCFEAPCSTTFPCYRNTSHYNERVKLDNITNKTCIVQYY